MYSLNATCMCTPCRLHTYVCTPCRLHVCIFPVGYMYIHAYVWAAYYYVRIIHFLFYAHAHTYEPLCHVTVTCNCNVNIMFCFLNHIRTYTYKPPCHGVVCCICSQVLRWRSMRFWWWSAPIGPRCPRARKGCLKIVLIPLVRAKPRTLQLVPLQNSFE